MHRVVCSVPLPSFPLTTGGGCFIFPFIRWYSTHGGNYLRVWVKDPSWEISTQEYYSIKIYHHVMGKHVICLILQKKWGIFKSVKEDGCNTFISVSRNAGLSWIQTPEPTVYRAGVHGDRVHGLPDGEGAVMGHCDREIFVQICKV